ncbi:hypothetical protein CC1G_08949 [Coprinopsis cinerea okayama7|uniref:Extracellular membrane protein CFEM domain-containing protein n=1 Tax=Coprinopsis cinerea (strain Okayama-7 / 130 / ATCC MYA-4618 / FGSC 9003) TaxID=240176 RepID=A8P4Q0_COPC7|nr:hypothetical protein CC1G_08949 [Coprinopsis cinerea okayama7\|eukprot:XP_001838785.1 hypothetical protein CC1G_08949 [Coprinopsis cinerea okayama7\
MQFKLAAIAALLVPTLVVAAPQGGDLCITNCANEAAVAVGCRDATDLVCILTNAIQYALVYNQCVQNNCL